MMTRLFEGGLLASLLACAVIESCDGYRHQALTRSTLRIRNS